MAIANKNAPFGFRLLRPGGKAEPRYVTRTVASGRAKDLMVGDSYTLDTSVTNVTNVKRAATASDVVIGVVAGIDLRAIAASPKGPVSQDYIPAAEAGTIIGIEDNDAEFRTLLHMASPGTNPVGTLLQTVGNAFGVIDADGDTLLAQSRQLLNGDDTTNKNFILLQLLDSPADNTDADYAQVVVRLAKSLQSYPTP